jgi:hypothetical protein
MWQPRCLTTLWAFTACYRDSFTFFATYYRRIFWHFGWLIIRNLGPRIHIVVNSLEIEVFGNWLGLFLLKKSEVVSKQFSILHMEAVHHYPGELILLRSWCIGLSLRYADLEARPGTKGMRETLWCENLTSSHLGDRYGDCRIILRGILGRQVARIGCDSGLRSVAALVLVLYSMRALLPENYLLKNVKRESYPCNKPWRPIGLWDVETPTFPRQSDHRWR